jgi:ParB-like chromosome segregation protein Spo0J
MEIRINIQVERRPISRLIPRITNPRIHSPAHLAQIAASMREWGWTSQILVGADNDLLAGHARLLAARQLGMEEVPVIQLGHLSEAQPRALVIADHQLALNAGWDEETLRAELAALEAEDFNIGVIGFEDEELARLLGHDEAAELTDEDAVPDPPGIRRARSATSGYLVLTGCSAVMRLSQKMCCACAARAQTGHNLS